MLLLEFVEAVYLNQRVVGPGHAQHLRDTVRMLGRVLGREPLVADLTEANANALLRSLEGTRAGSTLAGRRGCIVSLARCAADNGLLPREFRHRLVRRYRKSPKPAATWAPDEVARLADSAGKLRGVFLRSRVPRGAWFRALILTAYETGLRPVDLRTLRRQDFDGDGVLRLRQHKTGVALVRCVRRETLAAIDATEPGNRPLLFGGVVEKNGFGEWFARIVKAAGLRGTLYTLRKSCGTQVELRHPGMGHVALGNGRAVFLRHYMDASKAAILMPPEIPKVG